MTIRVLLADDQTLIRAGFKMMLSTTDDLEVVGEAANGVQAVQMVRQLSPDVVLMDVRMPVMDGIEATRKIVTDSDSRVLILTTFDLDEYAYEGLRAGAGGFLLKDAPPDVLYDAVRAIAVGDAVLTPRITRDLVDLFARTPAIDSPSPSNSDPIEQLTSPEKEVFFHITGGLSNGEIASAMFLAEPTIKTHITRVLTKLELRDRVQVVIFAYENGLR